MLLKLNNAYLIKDKKQLKEFYNDLKTLGIANTDNSHLLYLNYFSMTCKAYVRITIPLDGRCVYGGYPKNLPLTTKDLTRYQSKNTCFKVPCQLYKSSKSLKYNKDSL